LIDAETHASPPTESCAVTWHAFDVHAPLDAGDPVQLLDHAGRLQLALRRQRDVLEVTPATASGPGVLAWWLHAIGRSTKNFRRIGAEERGRGRRDLCHDPLSGNRMAHEDDSPIGCPRDTPATACDVAHVEFKELTETAPRVRHAREH
jgi:hypothetical protein